MAAENLRLGVLAFPHGVDTKLGQQQRFVARNILQAVEVVRKGARFMKIDIEADEIETGRLQELRRGKIDEGDEPLRIHLLDDCGEPVDEMRNALRAVPAGE